MKNTLPKLSKRTLVEDFIEQFEKMILSGQLQVDEKLPSERDLAAQLGVSRPVVHEGLINLAAKGLVTRSSRGGTVVNDYRQSGSLAMLNSLLNYHDGVLNPKLADSTMAFRFLFEVENARLAAHNRTAKHLEEMRAVLEEENALQEEGDVEAISELDFRFHHLIALATDNIFYPLLFNSFRAFYLHNVRMFFSIREHIPIVFQFHAQLVDAIASRDEGAAADVMRRMLEHGEAGYQRLTTGK